MKSIDMILASALALSSSGCLTMKGGQVQVAYGKGEDIPGNGKLELIGPRSRLILEDSTGGELRLGADVFYGKLPTQMSERTYNVDVGYGGYGFQEDAVVNGVTKSSRIKISLPIDYKIPWSFCGNISTYDPVEKQRVYPLKRLELTYPDACDVELGFLLTIGYNIDITVKETDYYSGTNTLNDIPGVEPAGQFYGEFGHELLLFGRFPIGLSIRVDSKENVTPFFSAGYRIE
jgi:hypothetical protein